LPIADSRKRGEIAAKAFVRGGDLLIDSWIENNLLLIVK
jgi:hypothetical protein